MCKVATVSQKTGCIYNTDEERNYVYPLSEKALDFILSPIDYLDVLEGVTNSGKSTVGTDRFAYTVSLSNQKDHLIIGKTKGIVARNLIQNTNGLCDKYKCQYFPNGNGKATMAHVEWGNKIIFVAGYSDKQKWSDILGGRYGVAFIDEANIADYDFVNELMYRCDYVIFTLNPADDRLPLYKGYINRCRPYKKYEKDVPKSIMDEMLKYEPRPKSHYWFFDFKDNLSLTEERIHKIKNSIDPESNQYKNKILGLRGRATGLVFPMFKQKNIVSKEQVKQWLKDGTIKPLYYSCGVDTAYSSKSDDATVFIYQMITLDKKCIVLDEAVFNNRDLENPLAPSDTVPNLVKFLDKNRREWGYCQDVFIDSADPGTRTECEKYAYSHPMCSYVFNPAYKSVRVVDRITMQQSWIYTGHYLVCDNCKYHIDELKIYSWDEKKIETPEDRNDHSINASQYGWIPYRYDIGNIEIEHDEGE